MTLEGRDIAGQAQTGTGKTAAFLVAAYNRLLNEPAMPQRRAQDPRMVIIAPTRELAVQIEKDARQIGANTDIRLALIYGGVDYDKQRTILQDGVDLIIATPGRLIDYIKQDVVSFRAIEMMVMDEADRMFELASSKTSDSCFVVCRTRANDRICCSQPPLVTACSNWLTST